MTKLNDYAWKWRVMDSNLGFREGELNHFQAGTQHQDAPNCYLRTMLFLGSNLVHPDVAVSYTHLTLPTIYSV